MVNAMVALYLNVFVLIVELFLKVPALKALAPTRSELSLKVAQLFVLVLFVLQTVIAALRFSDEEFHTA